MNTKLVIIMSTFELLLLLHPANAIVSEHPAMADKLNSDYLYNLLIAFFAIACSTLLIILVVHYYRIQWGRKSILTR
jgi:hypothetical protein